jgi:PEP-CTERM motif-containing protein
MHGAKILWACVSLVFLGVPLVARAQVVHYSIAGTISSSSVFGAINGGDNWSLGFDLNLGATSVDFDAQTKAFPGAITNLTFALGPGSTGNYPGGTIASAPLFLSAGVAGPSAPVDVASLTGTASLSTGFSFPAATPFPGITWPIDQMYLYFMSDAGKFNFVSGTQSLASALGTSTYLGSFDSESIFWQFSGGGTRYAYGDITGVTASAIPEPSTYAISFGIAALGVAFWRRLRLTPSAVMS